MYSDVVQDKKYCIIAPHTYLPMNSISLIITLIFFMLCGSILVIKKTLTSQSKLLKELLSKSQMLETKITAIENNQKTTTDAIAHLQETDKEIQGHNKVTDILLTKIKADIAKLSTSIERTPQQP